MSILYEVNLFVNREVVPAYDVWLDAHIAELLALGLFTQARWLVVEADDAERVHYAIHYTARTRADLERYLAEHAPRMREDGIKKFGAAFTATRRILEEKKLFG